MTVSRGQSRYKLDLVGLHKLKHKGRKMMYIADETSVESYHANVK
jgi:hypothetical protein